jgi:HSP20 family protein
VNAQLTPWDPWKELARIRAETDRLWEAFLTKLTRNESDEMRIAFLPDVDFVETASDYRLYLSVPGLVEEDIDIGVSERTLTVRGERQPPYDPEHARRCVREWRYGYFERRFELPKPISPTAIHATYESGVLVIVVAKPRGNGD